MTGRTKLLPGDVYDYVLQMTREPDALAQLRTATASVPQNVMQIGADQGALMALLVHLIGAKRCIEVGTYTGYSALAVALALPADGKLITCDISAEWTAVGQKLWRKAGVADRIDLRLKPALETLDELLAAGEAGRFDFAFIDADKPNYWNYYERAYELVRNGGLIGIDNTLWLARPADPSDQSSNTVAIRDFNRKIHDDARVMISIVPIGDGLTLALKK
jgi:predicted O-methyltransferase YrrM